jgi:hypothetical protein
VATGKKKGNLPHYFLTFPITVTNENINLAGALQQDVFTSISKLD